MKSGILLSVIALCSIVISCNSPKETVPVDFPQVNLPVYINDQMQAVNFMAKNYWNNFFAIEGSAAKEGQAVHGVDSVSFESAFGAYAQILSMCEGGIADKSVVSLFKNLDSLALAGEKKPLLKIMQLMEHYFYNPVSPVLDEEIYLSALNGIIASRSLSELDKMQYEWQHRICAMNRVGTPAADFRFRELLGNGNFRERSMYSIRGEYTLLFFNNPDCPSCAQILDVIKDSPLVGMVDKGELKVLAMYIDEDLAAWKENREKYPAGWIYAYDQDLILRDNGLYGLRAIPSLYLLDKEKRVILKDAPVEKVISYFMQR